MSGAEVGATWEPGSPITWKGEYDGRAYEDKGEILEVEPGRRLAVTHFSPLSGQEDRPENYHRLIYEIEPAGDHTRLRLEQDNAGSPEEAEHSRQTWQTMLDNLKAWSSAAELRPAVEEVVLRPSRNLRACLSVAAARVLGCRRPRTPRLARIPRSANCWRAP